MNSSISAIKFTNHGIKDNSSRANVTVETPVAQFTPLVPLITEKGPDGIQIINVEQFTGMYGEGTLEPTSVFYNHQSAMLDECIRRGLTTVAIKRVIPKSAQSASLSIGVDANFPTSWYVGSSHTAKKEATYKPILDFFTPSQGSWGNKYGVVISPATEQETLRLGLMEDIKVYRFRLVRMNDSDGRQSTITNRWGDFDTLFTFKPNTIGRGGIDYYIESIIKTEYIDANEYPILGNVRFYVKNFDELVKASPNYDASVSIWNQDLNSIFDTGLTIYKLFSGEHPIMLTGGDDGLTRKDASFISENLNCLKIYDDAVFEFLNSLTDSNPFTDIAKYPYSTIIDTGFSYRTKIAFGTLLNTRRDCWAMLSAFSVADHFVDENDREYFALTKDQTERDLQAAGNRLTVAFRLYPDSHKFGTAALRAMIVKNTGVKMNTDYKKRQSMVSYIAGELAAFMGSSDGNWREEFAIDSERNRVINGWTNINVGYQSQAIREQDAINSLIAIENYTTKQHFIPIYRTIYPDHTSVLSDAITMFACCYLEKLGAAAWRQYVNVRMSDAKRMESITNFINSGVEHKFNGRFVFKPRISYNDQGGLTEDIVVEIHANKAKTQELFTIESYRRTSNAGSFQPAQST